AAAINPQRVPPESAKDVCNTPPRHMTTYPGSDRGAAVYNLSLCPDQIGNIGSGARGLECVIFNRKRKELGFSKTEGRGLEPGPHGPEPWRLAFRSQSGMWKRSPGER